MTRFQLPLAVFVVSSLVSLVGCGGTTNADAVGPSAVDSSVVRVELGYAWAGAPLEKDKCTQRYAPTNLTFDRGSKLASWRVCERGAMIDRSKTMTDEEAAGFEEVLARIHYEDDFGCDGYDGMMHRMTTKAADGSSQLYVDQNINCMNDGRRRAPAVRDAYNALLALMPKE